MTLGAPNPKDTALAELLCNWFDIGNWRWSCRPEDEQYYPNQWWSFHALTIYALPTAVPSVNDTVVDVDGDIIDALRMHKIVCHPLTVQAVEGLGLKCSEVTTIFPNVTDHIVLSNGKLILPPRVVH
jgi:hypothetical protein